MGVSPGIAKSLAEALSVPLELVPFPGPGGDDDGENDEALSDPLESKYLDQTLSDRQHCNVPICELSSQVDIWRSLGRGIKGNLTISF